MKIGFGAEFEGGQDTRPTTGVKLQKLLDNKKKDKTTTERRTHRPEDEQSVEEDRRVGSKEEILDKALVFCSRLERLGLSDGQMYPSRLKVEGSGAFCAKDAALLDWRRFVLGGTTAAESTVV
ncbi:hypothetical protein BY996DRAFT_6528076, partial [Phakopsora pachyrhizi]